MFSLLLKELIFEFYSSRYRPASNFRQSKTTSKGIGILPGCKVRMDGSVPMVLFDIVGLCRVMQNSDLEGGNFLFARMHVKSFFFILSMLYIFFVAH